MKATIALPVLSADDAIGHDALGMAKALREAGYDVSLAAEKSLIAEDVRPIADLEGGPGDLLIYHHSYGCDLGIRAVRKWSGRIAIKYHNVTPPRFFASEHRRDAEAGLRQTSELAAVAPFWCDSAFNMDGLPDAAELPPFMPTEELRALDPDAAFAHRLDDWTTTLLCVGRVAPNKNLLLAIDALAAYRDRYDSTARLIIAGRHVFPDYSDALQSRIREHHLEESVAITGKVSPTQLKALYLAADALLVTSEHEGFCVPLVEAMALGVPIVAVPMTAVPGTAGESAHYVEPSADALAEGIRQLVEDGELREKHLLAGTRRYQECFAPAAIRARFMDLIKTLSA